MKIDQVAVILYTLRDFVQSEDGLRETLEKVAEIGYKSVQVSGIRPEGPEPACIRKACDEFGLTICATHENSRLILEDPLRVIDRLDIFGADFTAYPFPLGVDFKDPRAIGPWLRSLEKSNLLLREKGKVLAYHNHDIEFLRHGGHTIYSRIFEETSLVAELDTYWVQAGGASVLEWTEKLASVRKLPLLHLKDYAMACGRTPQFAPVGAGNIHFKSIVAAADSGGCLYYIVEQDNCYGRDPFECIAESFAFIRDHLVD